MEIKKIEEQHYPEIARIYLEGIATGNATFQTDAPAWKDWNESHLQNCRVAIFDGYEMLGWAALAPVSSRCVYAGVAEVSIYIAASARGRGVGKLLLTQLIHESEAAGLWTLQAGIFPENISSIKLHEACGFRIIGYREKIGRMKAVWRDNIILERRSNVVGIS